jgi:hypothetical protein
MKHTILILLALACASGAFAQVTVSTSAEPALNAPARMAVSATVGYNISPYSNLFVRYASRHTLTAGYTRDFVEFGRGYTLYGDAQLGETAYWWRMRLIGMYGAGVRTDLGSRTSVSYGVHINKIAGWPAYPSLYVELGWGGNRW